MPGLKLTEAQAQRLWGIDGRTWQLVLTTLLEQRFLRRTPGGTYVRGDECRVTMRKHNNAVALRTT
jgi:hypothetical protein